MKPGRKKKVCLAAAAGLIGLAALIALSGPSAERRELNHWLDRSRNANLHSEEFYEEQGPELAPRLLEVMREKPSSLKLSIQRWGARLGWNERNTDYLKQNHDELRRQTERSQMAADVFHRVEWDTEAAYPELEKMLRRALTANDEHTAGFAIHALTSFGARATTLLVGMYRTNPLARKLLDEKFKEPLPASVSLQYTHFERTRRIRRALAPIAEQVNLYELNGSDPAVQAQALKNICQSQLSAETVVPLLVDIIKDPTHSLRPLALEGLGRFYVGQLPSLKSELADLSHLERLKLESNAASGRAIARQTAGFDSDERFYRTRSGDTLHSK